MSLINEICSAAVFVNSAGLQSKWSR